LLEGGIRVPAIVRWPGVAPANRATNQMAITMDWTATILAAAEASAAVGYPLDGSDLLPVIRGASPVSDRTFFWRLRTQDAVREGKWKYLRKEKDQRLFDLSIDEREQADFSLKNPDIMGRLSSAFDKWNEQMLPRPAA
jgi:arylsulfatase A-like enzyme